MHPVSTLLHWSHHMHESMNYLWHSTIEHLHSRHFWAGVTITLFAIGILTLLFLAVMYGSFEFTSDRYLYGPYGF